MIPFINNYPHRLIYSGNSQQESRKNRSRPNHLGVEIVVSNDFKVDVNFTEVSERICFLDFELDKVKFRVISAHAPTLPVSEKNPEAREEFYSKLEVHS